MSKIKAAMMTRWFLAITTIIMMANAARDYKEKEYVGMSLALAAVCFGLAALYLERRNAHDV